MYSSLRHIINHRAAGLVLLACALVLIRAPVSIAASPPIQGAACTTAPAGPDPTPTVCIADLTAQIDGISPNNSFTVSWRTPQPQTGQVKLIGGSSFDDVRGAAFNGTTHYVLVNNLEPGISYQFDIVSGGTTYNKSGAHWSANLGPALPPRTSGPSPDTILGVIKNPDGENADDALVYAIVQQGDGAGSGGRSSLLSQILTADDAGFFHIDLAQARTSNGSAWYDYSPTADKLIIRGVNKNGFGATNVSTGTPRAGKPVLSLTIGSGSSAAQTATPTLPLPTSTPTVPTSATTITPTETLTPTLTLTPVLSTDTPELPTRAPATEPPPTPGITIAPAGETSSAGSTALTPTAPSEPNQETETAVTHIIFAQTATPSSSQSGAGLSSRDLSIVLLAVVLFIGAVLLGLAGFFIFRR